MDRYTVAVTRGDAGYLQLLVPCRQSSTLSQLLDEIAKRAAKQGITFQREHVLLRLGRHDGPILDLDDSIEETIISPSTEIIYVTSPESEKRLTSRPQQRDGARSEENTPGSFKIRVITPSLAQKSGSTAQIPPLNHGMVFSGQTLLREIRSAVQSHLGIQADELESLTRNLECNCVFTQQILDRKILDLPTSGGILDVGHTILGTTQNEDARQTNQQSSDGPPSRILVIYGRSEVEWAEADGATDAAIQECLRRRFGQAFLDARQLKLMSGLRGVEATNRYSRMPIVCLCSRARHQSHNQSTSPAGSAQGFTKILDLHTFEAPITTSNYDLTVNQIGLHDLTIDGVLNLYAVTRDASESMSFRGSGKDAIFLEAECWRPPVCQSERGMAALLSCLRVFTDMIGANEMEEHMQNVILDTIQWLTRFPPATRAMHILMDGKTPTAFECAALSQALFEVLKAFLPRNAIKGEQKSVLEPSRLLFGYIMDRAKQATLAENEKMPYLEAFKTLDLRDACTNEIMEFPVQSDFGLVEKGYADAYCATGVLGALKSQHSFEMRPPISQLQRIAVLSGGTASELSYYDLDSLNMLAKKTSTSEDRKLLMQAFSDLRYLASLCERTGLTVVPPSTLRTSNAPVLTLDREGLIAVYTGRPPCTDPPNDTAMFRPTKGGEVNVDIAIITQLLEPILAKREENGTLVFDLYGEGARRKDQKPEEIVIFCVDCSRSMSSPSDFDEITDMPDLIQDDDAKLHSAGEGLVAELGTFVNPTFEDMKDFLIRHESFVDMLAIVKGTRQYDQQMRAAAVIKFITSLLSRELCVVLDDFRATHRWATMAYMSAHSGHSNQKLTRLRKQLAGLNQHKQGLCDFLAVKAQSTNLESGSWTWSFGDTLPAPPAPLTQEIRSLISTFSVPDEFMCPIGHELLDDAVTASDGKNYERKAIERWFQIRTTSPSTNLQLTSLTLRRNGQLINRIQEWTEGKAIIEQYNPPKKRLLRGNQSSRHPTVSVKFVSPTDSFTRTITPQLPVSDLFGLAYQGMRGRYPNFSLSYNGEALGIGSGPRAWDDNALIRITIHTGPATTTGAAEQCLVKVYDNEFAEKFAYWTTKSTTNTLASVIFRNWRFNEENRLHDRSHDKDVWTDMRYGGDGVSVGYVQNHWKGLSSFLNPANAKGVLQEEGIYDTQSPGLVITGGVDEPGNDALVLKLRLYGRDTGRNHDKDKNLSRLDVSKQVFGSFINRTLAYNYPVHIGLVTFEDTAKLTQVPSGVVENFRRSINNMEAKGDTALWDALALAADQLAEHGKEYPDAKKRIICLSDGVDNKSERAVQEALKSIISQDIVVDSFCIGNEDNQDIRVVSHVTGGYKFQPKSLEQAMAICEMEPVLSQLERPNRRVRSTVPSHTEFRSLKGKAMINPETVNRDIFPLRKRHPGLDDTFVQLSAMAKVNTGNATSASNDGSRTNMRSTRLLNEIKNIANNIHPSYNVYVSESNMGFWKVVMKGPPQSAYSDGTFVLYLDMEDDYPAFPPKGRFDTPIFHPNINRHGRICHSILDRNWTTDTTNLQVLNTIYSLLLVPEFSDPINTVVTLDYYWDEVQFQEEVRQHIRRHATKDQEQWKKEILGEYGVWNVGRDSGRGIESGIGGGCG